LQISLDRRVEFFFVGVTQVALDLPKSTTCLVARFAKRRGALTLEWILHRIDDLIAQAQVFPAASSLTGFRDPPEKVGRVCTGPCLGSSSNCQILLDAFWVEFFQVGREDTQQSW